MLRVNVGCGTTPTPGWLNFDNSLTVRLATIPVVSNMVLWVLREPRASFARQVRLVGIKWADSRRLPLPDGSAEVLYSSHMLEHLSRLAALQFLAEAYRVLAPGGVLRLAVPDLMIQVRKYLDRGDADAFIEGTGLAPVDIPATFSQRLRFLVAGYRGHAWMYDARSLSRMVTSAGFVNAEVVRPGETRIVKPEPLNLREREDESLYVEARR